MQVTQNPQAAVDSWYRGKDKYRHDNSVKYKGNDIILDTNKGDDDIRVRKLEDARYQVDVNGTHYHFTAEEMQRLKIDGGKGNDRLLIDPSASDLDIRTKNIENVGSRYLDGAPAAPTTEPGNDQATNPNAVTPLDSVPRPNFTLPPWYTAGAQNAPWSQAGMPSSWMNGYGAGFWNGYATGQVVGEMMGYYAYYNGPPPGVSMGPNAWGW